MASSAKVTLLEESLAAANSTSESTILGTKSKDFVGYLVVSNYSAGTVNATIEHSPDGVNWFSLMTLGPLSANGADLDFPTSAVLGHVRAVVTGTPTADVRVDLAYSEAR